MRLLHVSHQYRPAVGGAEQYITNLSEELAARGHHVTVFASRSLDYRTWQSVLPPREELAGVQVRRFRALTRGPGTWRALDYGYRRYWRSEGRQYQPLILVGNGPVCPGLLAAALREASGFDLVHINNLHYAHAATAYWAARRQGVPIVLTPHIHAEQPATYRVGYMLEILRGSDHVLADTPAERQLLVGAGLDHQQVTTAGVGLRLQEFPILDPGVCRRELGLPENAFVLLFLGRKTEYKGLGTTLEAFSRLQDQHPHLHLVALGRETEYSQRLWDRYDGLPRLLVSGGVDDEVRLKALNASDCLVMPSTGEAFGIVYLEAWAVGKPVIAARTPAVSSLVSDGLDGLLVEPANAHGLAGCITRLMEDRALGRALGRQGRRKVESRYALPRITDIVEGVYARVLRRSVRGPAAPPGAGVGRDQIASLHSQ